MALTLLRLEVEAAAVAELERVGPTAFRRETIVRRFSGCGAAPATLYRWIQRAVDFGKVGAVIAAKVRKIALERASEPALPPPLDPGMTDAMGLAVVAAMPRRLGPGDIASGGGMIAVARELQSCIGLGQQIIKQSIMPDGTLRLTKTALAASENTRRCLETSVRMAEALRDITKVTEFHDAVVEEIAKEAPACAERVLGRLYHLTSNYICGARR